MQRQEHWDVVYETKGEQQVSWFESLPVVSLRLMESAGLTTETCVVDIGGGDSRLVDQLAARGLDCLAVLDVSGSALEQYKLELHSGELLTLLETLGPLYRARWQERGPLLGMRTYVRMETSLARFLKLGQAELEAFLDTHPEDAAAVLGKLVQWLTSASAEASKALAALDPGRLPAVTALLGLSALKSALAEWEANASNPSEAFWEKTLSKHSFVLSHLFAHPVVVIEERAYLGGKALDDKGGSYLDFLTAASATNGVALVEIKSAEDGAARRRVPGRRVPAFRRAVGRGGAGAEVPAHVLNRVLAAVTRQRGR